MNLAETYTRDYKMWRRTILLAQTSTYSTRVGCLAAKGHRTLCGAVNTVRNDGRNVPYGEATRHAEINTLRMLESASRITLYIVRIRRDTILPSRPCNNCMKDIRSFGIADIVYMDDFRRITKETLR